jgi:hypothetical protein|tara:strand:- start:71 stop:313 length:243 start_codon:yes stop_codon:yes gene_type:complete
MDFQKITTGVTAAAVVGTGAVVGGGQIIDNMNDGPARRQEAQLEEIRKVIREEIYIQLVENWPKTSGPVKGYQVNPIPKK